VGQISLTSQGEQNSLTPQGSNNIYFRLSHDQIVLLENVANFYSSQGRANNFFTVLFLFLSWEYNKTLKVHLTPIPFLSLNNFRNFYSTVVKKILNLLKYTTFQKFPKFKNCAKLATILVQVRVIGGIGVSICYDVERRMKAWFDCSQQPGQQQSTRVFWTSKCRRCVGSAAGCSNERNVEGISLHKLPFCSDDRPEAKTRKKKQVDFVWLK